jgi:hypothetical protein
MRPLSMPRLTDEQVELVVARERRVEDVSLRELAAFVDATRELCLEPAPPALAERQMAMIVAASQSAQVADAHAQQPREHRLGLPPRARHWGAALAAFALALVVAGVLLLAGSDDQHAKRVSDRAGPAQIPDRAGPTQVPDRAVPLKPTFRLPPPTQPRRDDTPRAGSRSRERPAALPPSAPAPATPPSAEQAPGAHAGLQPNAPVAPSEPPVERAPVGGPERPADPDPQPRPYRGYGGPDSEPTPLKGPLDTEQPIPISP